MIEGEFEVTFSDHTIRLTRGDGLFVPSGEESKHKATAGTAIARVPLVDEGDATLDRYGL